MNTNNDSHSGNMKALRHLILAAILLTFFSMVAGGIMRVSNSSGACADWPTCLGSWTAPTLNTRHHRLYAQSLFWPDHPGAGRHALHRLSIFSKANLDHPPFDPGFCLDVHPGYPGGMGFAFCLFQPLGFKRTSDILTGHANQPGIRFAGCLSGQYSGTFPVGFSPENRLPVSFRPA